MFSAISNLYKWGSITKDGVMDAVKAKLITAEEAEIILAAK